MGWRKAQCLHIGFNEQLKGCLLGVLCGCQTLWTRTRGEAWEEMCADIYHPWVDSGCPAIRTPVLL